MVFGLEQEDESIVTAMAPVHSIPLETGQGISAGTCGLDDVFPPVNQS